MKSFMENISSRNTLLDSLKKLLMMFNLAKYYFWTSNYVSLTKIKIPSWKIRSGDHSVNLNWHDTHIIISRYQVMTYCAIYSDMFEHKQCVFTHEQAASKIDELLKVSNCYPALTDKGSNLGRL